MEEGKEPITPNSAAYIIISFLCLFLKYLAYSSSRLSLQGIQDCLRFKFITVLLFFLMGLCVSFKTSKLMKTV